MPVPSLAKEKIKRRIKLKRYKEEAVAEINLEFSQQISNTDLLSLETLIMESEKYLFSLRITRSVFQVSVVPNESDNSATVVTQNTKDCPQAPPTPKTKQQQCQKHTKCHCDLLSLGTNNFFSVAA